MLNKDIQELKIICLGDKKSPESEETMGFKNKKANNNQVQETKKTGLGAAFSNAKSNICDAMDKVTPGHGVAAGVGMIVGAGAVYGINKAAQKRANAAECAAADESVGFTERRR